MTIVVAASSPEGIALGADSRTTQRSGSHERVASDAARKVFSVADKYGVATYGIATIGDKTIPGLVDEWRASEEQGLDSLKACGESLGSFFEARLQAATPAKRGRAADLLPRTWPLGFLLAGYDEAGVGRVLEVKVWSERDFEVADTGLDD